MHTTETNLACLAGQALNCRTTETHSLRIVAFGTALPLSAHLPFFDETTGVLTVAVDLPPSGTVEADLRQQLEDEAAKVSVLMTARSALGRKVRELEAELVEARAELAQIKQDEPQSPYPPEVRSGDAPLGLHGQPMSPLAAALFEQTAAAMREVINDKTPLVVKGQGDYTKEILP